MLQGADDSLCSLLRDVLGDMGLAVRASAGGPRPDVVLALVQREDSVPRALRRVEDETGGVPVLVLLPFEDERLRQLAMSLGACGCYALGTPLEALKGLLRDVVGGEDHTSGRQDEQA